MPHRWNTVAKLRREQIESGKDLTFSAVYVPWYQKLLSVLRPTSVLEIGGGTGHLAKALSADVVSYCMLEPSDGMFKVAKDVLRDTTNVSVIQQPIQEHSGDKYDLLLSHFCAQTVAHLDEFVSAASRHMTEDGWFVFSIPHPAFYNSYKRFFAETQYRYFEQLHATVEFGITLDSENRISGVPYHHRPLTSYFDALHGCGLSVHLFDEVFPPAEIQARYGEPWLTPRYLTFGARHTTHPTLLASALRRSASSSA